MVFQTVILPGCEWMRWCCWFRGSISYSNQNVELISFSASKRGYRTFTGSSSIRNGAAFLDIPLGKTTLRRFSERAWPYMAATSIASGIFSAVSQHELLNRKREYRSLTSGPRTEYDRLWNRYERAEALRNTATTIAIAAVIGWILTFPW